MSHYPSACPELPCILVVDDSRLARVMVRKALEGHCALEIVEASGGAEAIEKFKACRPVAVVMDLTMPGMDGLEAIARIKCICPQAKIVVVTADVQDKSVELARRRGALAVLPKPLEPARLRAIFKELLHEKA